MSIESIYQAKLIKKIKDLLPGCFVFKTNPNYIQGIPDLLVICGDRWAALEVKRFVKASYRPNQSFYIKLLDKMSFARTVYPENEEEVLDELVQSFAIGG